MPARSLLGPELRRWLLSWLLFTALGCTWALATPVLGVPDEPAHTVYAAAAVRGEVWAQTQGPITKVTVPAGWANVDAVPGCFAFSPTQPAGCAPALTTAAGTAEVNTSAGRYPPLYYFYAGLPTLLTGGAKAVYLMRGLTAALVGALLASGFCSILSLRRRLLPVTGFLLAATPTLFFFAGAVNPQAPEIAAAVCLWVSGAVLLRRMGSDPDEPLTWRNPHLRRVLLASAVLTVVRPMSLLWLAVIVVTLVLLFGNWGAVLRLLRSRAVLTALPVLALTAGSTLAWIVLRNALGQQAVDSFANLSRSEATTMSVAKLNDEFQQMVGWFGWLDSPAPGWVFVLYLLALGTLAAIALPLLRRGERVTVALVVAFVLAFPVVLEVSSYRESAFAWQGRYMLPIAVGIPLLLGLLPGRRVSAPEPPTVARPGHATAIAAAVVSLQVVAFVGELNRNIYGANGFWGLTPVQAGWRPPVPAVLLVVLAVGLITAGGWFARRLVLTGDIPEPAPAGRGELPSGGASEEQESSTGSARRADVVHA